MDKENNIELGSLTFPEIVKGDKIVYLGTPSGIAEEQNNLKRGETFAVKEVIDARLKYRFTLPLYVCTMDNKFYYFSPGQVAKK